MATNVAPGILAFLTKKNTKLMFGIQHNITFSNGHPGNTDILLPVSF